MIDGNRSMWGQRALVFAAWLGLWGLVPVAAGDPPQKPTTTQSPTRARSVSQSSRSSHSLRTARTQAQERPRSGSISAHVSQRVRAASVKSESPREENQRTVGAARRLSIQSVSTSATEQRAAVEALSKAGGANKAKAPSLRALLRRAFGRSAKRDHDAATLERAKNQHNATTLRSGPSPKGEYPPNGGFAGKPVERTLQPGDVIDRYGSEGGRFTSPVGTPFPARSLKPAMENGPYARYQVVQPIKVVSGPAVPWFEQPGGGIQHFMGRPVRALVEEGALKKLP